MIVAERFQHASEGTLEAIRAGEHLTDAEESRQLSRLVSLSVRLFGIQSRRFSSLPTITDFKTPDLRDRRQASQKKSDLSRP